MTRKILPTRSIRRGARALLIGSFCAMLSLSACDKGGAAIHGDSENGGSSTSTTGAVSMCKLMPKEEVNSTIGSVFTIAEATEDRGSSSCHYSTESDPAGLSLNMDWIQPGDYSSPAEHAALQKAGLGGAKLGASSKQGWFRVRRLPMAVPFTSHRDPSKASVMKRRRPCCS